MRDPGQNVTRLGRRVRHQNRRCVFPAAKQFRSNGRKIGFQLRLRAALQMWIPEYLQIAEQSLILCQLAAERGRAECFAETCNIRDEAESRNS